jgi:hypothetical protein
MLLGFLFITIVGESGLDFEVPFEKAQRAAIVIHLVTVVVNVIVSIVVAITDLDNVLMLRVCFGVFVPVIGCLVFITHLIETPTLQALDRLMQIDSIGSESAQLLVSIGTLRAKVRALCKQGKLLGSILAPLFTFYLSSSLLEIPVVGVVATALGLAPFLLCHATALWIIFPSQRRSVQPSPSAAATLHHASSKFANSAGPKGNPL